MEDVIFLITKTIINAKVLWDAKVQQVLYSDLLDLYFPGPSFYHSLTNIRFLIL